jgi:imidazolonepropionase-like amidohydrolase
VRQRFALVLAVLACACGAERPLLVRRPSAPPPALWIHDVAVLDVASGVRTPGRDVLVRGDRIEAITPAGASPAPADAEAIDGAGATLLPGLVDAHSHLYSDPSPPWQIEMPDPEAVMRAYLYCGVTTVFDAADATGDAYERRERVAAGLLLGPRIFTAGPPITAEGGHPVALVRRIAPWWIAWYMAPRTARQVSSPEQAHEAADEVARAGADVVKLMVDRLPDEAPRLGAAEIRAAVEAGHARGVRVVAHVGRLEDALDAARAGVDAWMHGVYRERIPDEAIAELASFGIPMVPTLTVFDSYAGVLDGGRVATPLERELATPALLAALETVPSDSAALAGFRAFLENLRRERASNSENVRRLHAAGVSILAGSDPQSGVFPGAGLHRELAMLVAAGFTPAEAIRAATLAPARFLTQKQAPDFGEIAVGRRADLLLVDGDPTADIAAVSSIRAVILEGVELEREAVNAKR